MSQPENATIRLVVVTGLSGAGKSTALNALEDLGFFCIDNLPPPVLSATLDALHAAGERRVALCLDIRAGTYLSGLVAALSEVDRRGDVDLSVLYLDSSEQLLARRFSATRRPHPLATGERSGIPGPAEGLAVERKLLAPLRARASMVLDTSDLNVHQLRQQIFEQYGAGTGTSRLRVRLVSFGYKYGLPHDADLLFDVRFLPNPYFVPALRPLSGLDAEVSDYVLSQEDCQTFFGMLAQLLEFCLPRYAQEGKSYLSLAIGCTGGRHRSVALVQALHASLSRSWDGSVSTLHRDIHRAEHPTITPIDAGENSFSSPDRAGRT